jgi:putative addiction module killer protein
MLEVIHYFTVDHRDVFADWVTSLRDQMAAARIAARIERLHLGLFGDCKPLDEGVWELRVDWGPGYRVYYARAGSSVILLLCGGDKRTQTADIKTAKRHWREWQKRCL